jgi:hypothetical protein
MPNDMTLEERVDAFALMELPGQPRVMHMGTSYLVNDLWREIQRLNAALSMTREGVEADEAKRQQNCQS